MSPFDDALDIPDVPDTPDVPVVPDAPSAPDVQTNTPTPGAPDTPGGGTPDIPDITAGALGSSAAPSVQVQQDIANLKDNSDLDTVKGSGPAATASTKDVGGTSNTQALAQQTLNGGEPNMSQAPGAQKPYTPGDFTSGPKGAGGGGKGLIDSAMDWAHDNPRLAAALVTGGMGAIGGAGKAALDKQTMERKAEIDQANAKDLIAYKQEQARNFSAAGTLQAPNVMQPAPGIINSGLKRPGGANVFGPNGRLQR